MGKIDGFLITTTNIQFLEEYSLNKSLTIHAIVKKLVSYAVNIDLETLLDIIKNVDKQTIGKDKKLKMVELNEEDQIKFTSICKNLQFKKTYIMNILIIALQNDIIDLGV